MDNKTIRLIASAGAGWQLGGLVDLFINPFSLFTATNMIVMFGAFVWIWWLAYPNPGRT